MDVYSVQDLLFVTALCVLWALGVRAGVSA